jgi:phosphoenolpyruvate carboxylase
VEDVVALFIPITFIIVVGLIAKWLSDNRLRRELANAGINPELAEKLMAAPAPSSDSSLKWGIVAIAVGLSLAVIQLAHLNEDDPVSFGIVFIFGGAGLLLHYFLGSRQE